MKKIGHPLGYTLEISVVASEVQSEPMEVEDASGQPDDMAKDTQTQGDKQTFVGSDGRDYVEPSSASGQSEPPFALVAEHLKPETKKTVLITPTVELLSHLPVSTLFQHCFRKLSAFINTSRRFQHLC